MKDIKGYPCITCNKERFYKTQQGADRSRNKNCNSCANSISGGGSGIKYNDQGKRLCSKCKTNAVGWNSYCDPCNITHRKAYHDEVLRFSKYGITKEIYLEQLEKQGYSCYACDSTDKLCIDHCHDTNEFRGILCHKCNVALGLLEDNTKTLTKLINYLNKEKNECK